MSSSTWIPTWWYGPGSNNQSIFNPNNQTSITIQGQYMSNVTNEKMQASYQLESVEFGNVIWNASGVPTNGSFVPLGFQNETQYAIVATNYQSIGLPEYLFWQLIQAIGQSNYVIGSSQLYCPRKSEDYVYYCWFQSTCANVADEDFWNNWVLKFKFAGTD